MVALWFDSLSKRPKSGTTLFSHVVALEAPSCIHSFIQVCNFLVGLFFLNLVEIFGVASVYGAFGGISLISALFCYYFLVETKGRSLEEIEISLNPNLRQGGTK